MESLFIDGEYLNSSANAAIEVEIPAPRRSSPRSPTPMRPTSTGRSRRPAGLSGGGAWWTGSSGWGCCIGVPIGSKSSPMNWRCC